ncbi:MAG: ABC transporter substrate-binding protein [Clostridiales bacterium]|nr:ABC transporter substrate-binding protein [Clostridiales bacterium]
MKNLRKRLALILSVVLMMTFIPALAQDDLPMIGIIQLMEHPALDAAREGFIEGLQELGFEDGKNIRIVHRNGQNNQDILASIADQFISEGADLVLAIATPAAQSMAGKSTTIPILATAITDFVSARMAESNEKPGYNISGTTDLNPIQAQIELIQRMAPDTKTVGLLYTASEDNSVLQAEMAHAIIEELGMEWKDVTVNNVNDVQQAAISLIDQVDALYIPTDNVVASSMPVVHEAAMAKKIPIFCSEAGQIEGGGTATLGISYFLLGKQTAQMAVDVLNGADISTMPIQAQTEFEYLINKTMADAIGLVIPEELLEFAVEIP